MSSVILIGISVQLLPGIVMNDDVPDAKTNWV